MPPRPRDPRKASVHQTPECPTCGHSFGTQIGNGWANDGTIAIRQYTCPNECPTYISGEFVLPLGQSTISGMDEEYRRRRRLSARQKQGYWKTAPRGGTVLNSDRIVYTLRIIRGARIGDPVDKPQLASTGKPLGRPRLPTDPKLEKRRAQYRAANAKRHRKDIPA